MMKCSLLLLFLWCLALPVSAQSFDLNAYRSTLLEQINRERAGEKLPPLHMDDKLNQISQEWAVHLADRQGLVHRSRSNLKDFLIQNHWSTMTENLFCASLPAEPDLVVSGWMKSPPHHHNLMNPKTDLAGFGIAMGKDGLRYVVFNGAKVAPPPPPPPAS